MEELRRQIAAAQRRLLLNQFLSFVGWSLFFALLATAAAIAIPRIWILPVNTFFWDGSWFAGGTVLGLAVAGLLVWLHGQGPLEAAIEIDRRFGLKERISTTLLLTPDERESEAGSALAKDAQRRAAQIAVADKFKITPTWPLLLPLAPILTAIALVLFCDALVPESNATASEEQAREGEQVRKMAELLKKKVERQAQEAEDKGLKDAQELFEKLAKTLDEVSKTEHIDRKQATLKLNDLTKEIDARRSELSPTEKTQQQLHQLNKLDHGPADKMAKAMKDGDFQKTAEELKGLRDKLENNELNAEEKEKLAQQLQQAEKKLKELAERQNENRENLQQQIAQKQAAGDKEGAQQLQRKLDQLQDQQPQIDALKDLAEKLGQAAESLKDGNNQQAAEQLQQLQKQAEKMQNDSDQLQQLDEMLDQIADAQKTMNCDKCNGKGCKTCQEKQGSDSADELLDEPGEQLAQGKGSGKGQKPKEGEKPGSGLGEGKGQGPRPEEKTDHKTFDSIVAGQVTKGAAVITGKAGGPNAKNQNRQAEIEAAVNSVIHSDADPLSDQTIPRSQRNHTRQYFDKLRKGN